MEYVYPPASLMQVNPDPAKPTEETLRGTNGAAAASRYILAWELEGMIRGQSLRCIQEWSRIHRERSEGKAPEPPPSYCVFSD